MWETYETYGFHRKMMYLGWSSSTCRSLDRPSVLRLRQLSAEEFCGGSGGYMSAVLSLGCLGKHGNLVNTGNHLQMAQQFRLVKYYNLPRAMENRHLDISFL